MTNSNTARGKEKSHSHGRTVASIQDSRKNEELADKIQNEWLFKAKRTPEHIVIRYGIVVIVLALLQLLLIVSNNLGPLGYWRAFTETSSEYRDAFRRTRFAHVVHLDSDSLDAYSLWRGWFVPGFLAASTYIFVSLLTLRHEFYHWKPELLEYYFETTRKSTVGQFIPSHWVEFAFHVYKDKHKKYIANHIQKRKHIALDDSKEFLKILRTVFFNISISFIVMLIWWTLLLQTKIEAHSIVQLPRSYVPPIQGLLWYLCNDFFYFYQHWIAHTGPPLNALYYKVLPPSVTKALHRSFNHSHKLHHKTKANLGIAAWYCSVWEHVFFNLSPALIGPLLTQMLADAAGFEQIWGTHLVTIYVWLMAASASSVLAHTGYRSCWNDPGKHDLHHERAFNPKTAVNFGTLGIFDWLHGTRSAISEADSRAWRAQRDRQAALYEASKRTGIALSQQQMEVIQQPDHSSGWVEEKTI
jgi:sterol desaturase/sphingolipid hydroxylase (fatty acid hydroxylase superfamily)